MTAFDRFQAATVMIAEGRRIAARQCIIEAITWIDRTGRDRHMRADLQALADSIGGFLSRHEDGTWSHPYDRCRWPTKADAATDLRFTIEWVKP